MSKELPEKLSNYINFTVFCDTCNIVQPNYQYFQKRETDEILPVQCIVITFCLPYHPSKSVHILNGLQQRKF